MSEQEQSAPQPLLVLVTGKPGSGKSTLALELGRAQNLGLPVLSRDALKAGMVETWAFVQPGTTRDVIETDERRSSLVPRSFALFYSTIASWLQAKTSLIAEYSFDRRCEPALVAIIGLAKGVVVHCEAPDELCQLRFLQREQADGKIRPDRLTATMAGIAHGTDPWAKFDPMKLSLPTIRVDTTCDYKPTLTEISAFCRDASSCLGSPLRN